MQGKIIAPYVGEGSRCVWVLESSCYSWNAHSVPSRPGNSGEEDRSLGMWDSHWDGLFMQGPTEDQGGRGI